MTVLEDLGFHIFNVALSVINGFISIFIIPIFNLFFSLLDIFVSDYTTIIDSILSNFEFILEDVILPNLVWVINLIPPFTFNICLAFVGIWLMLYTYEFTVGLIVNVLSFVKKIIPFV